MSLESVQGRYGQDNYNYSESVDEGPDVLENETEDSNNASSPTENEAEISGRLRSVSHGRVESGGNTDSDHLQYLDEVAGFEEGSGTSGLEEDSSFEQEINDAKDEFQQKLGELTELDPKEREKLTKEFNEKAEKLAHPKNIEQARSALDKLNTDMGKKVDSTLKAQIEQVKQEKMNNLDKAIQAMDLVISRTDNDNISGWWAADKADQLASKLKVYFQGLKGALETGGTPPSDSDIVSFVNGVNKDEINDVAQYLTGAMYELAGRDENAWKKMVRTSFSDSIMSALATRAIEDTGEMNEEVKPDQLKYWSASEVSSKLMDLKSNVDLQYLNPEHDVKNNSFEQG